VEPNTRPLQDGTPDQDPDLPDILRSFGEGYLSVTPAGKRNLARISAIKGAMAGRRGQSAPEPEADR